MYKLKIRLNNTDDVKDFINATKDIDCDMDISAQLRENNIVDAKSIMGIFSLDISKPLILMIHEDDKDKINDYSQILSKFCIKSKDIQTLA